MRVVVLHNEVCEGAATDERDVLVQRSAVTEALARLGHEALCIGCTLDLAEAKARIVEARPDVVFNLVEALGQTDRLVVLASLLLDALNIRYTGASTAAILATTNKLAAKRELRRAGVPTPEWFTREGPSRTGGTGSPSSVDSDEDPGRVILKSVWEHASFRMDDEALFDPRSGSPEERIRRCESETGRPFFAERYVEGREFNLTLLAARGAPRVLPPAEIDFSAFPAGKPRIVGYRAKWDEGSFEYRGTQRRFDFPETDAPLLDELRRLARRCWELFDLRGYGRVDFRVDGAGRPWVLEVNTNPCLAPDAGFAAAVEREGLGFHEAVGRILADAVVRPAGG